MWERARDYSPVYIFQSILLFPHPSEKPIYQKRRGRWRRDETAPLVFNWGVCINVSWTWESWILSELQINCAPKVAALNESVRGLPDLEGRQTGDKLFFCLTHCFLSRRGFLNRPATYCFYAQTIKCTEHLLDNTLSYTNNCPQHSKARWEHATGFQNICSV